MLGAENEEPALPACWLPLPGEHCCSVALCSHPCRWNTVLGLFCFLLMDLVVPSLYECVLWVLQHC